MAENLPDLKSKIVIDDSQVTEVLGRVGKQSEAMGSSMRKSADGAKLAFWGLGEAAENAAQSMGVPNQMSRQLGNATESLASKLGMAGLAFGAAGFAAMGLYAVYTELKDRKRQLQDETIKGALALANEVSGMEKSRGITNELRESNYQLYLVKREMAKFELERAIDAERQKMIDLTKNVNDLSGKYRFLYGDLADLEPLQEKLNSAQEKGNLRVKEAALTLSMHIATLKQLNDIPVDRAGFSGMSSEWENELAFSQLHMKYLSDSEAAEATYTANVVAMTQQRIFWDEQEAEVRRESVMGIIPFLAQSFQAMGEHSKRAFRLFKMAAIAETMVNADKAAMGAYSALAWIPGVGPGLGAAAAAVAYAAGLARVQSIRAMEFGSGGGGGPAGATPTYSASTTTGAPTGGGGTININFNGQPVGEYDLARGVMRTLYNNNGSIDGLSVAIEKSI